MPNLSQTINSNAALTSKKKGIRVGLTKEDLNLSASAESVCKSSKFYQVRIPVRKLPMLSAEASVDSGAIVIDVNAKRRKAHPVGFVPKVILLKGLKSLQAAKASNKDFCTVWAGERALKKLRISAEDAIGANALQNKLQRLITDKYRNQKSSKAADNVSYSPSPWIRELYPFDNYFVFDYDGDTYRQTFILNKETQEPELTGEPVEAIVQYIPAVTAASLADSLYGDTFIEKTMSQEMTLDKINVSSPALGSMAYTPQVVPDGTYYPSGSELARPELRTMLNVKEALAIFLNLLKDGMKGPMQNSFAPIGVPTDKFLMNACREAEIAAKESRKRIDTMAF